MIQVYGNVMSFELRWEPHGVVKRFFGPVSGAQFQQATEEVEGDERFDTLHFVINDFTDMSDLEATATHLERVAAIDGAAALSNPHIKVAVVSTDARVHALAAVYAGQHPYPSRVFERLADARAWCA